MDKKKRATKTTQEQYKYYVDFLQGNVALRTNKNTPENPNQLEEAYKQLAMGLNAIGGPERTANAWKKTLADWKSQAKKKARAIVAHNLGTGGGPPCSTKLTDLENKLLDTIGRIVVDGTPNMLEAKLPIPPPPPNDEVVLLDTNVEIIHVVNSADSSKIDKLQNSFNDIENQEPPNKKIRAEESRPRPVQTNKTAVEKVTDAYNLNQQQNKDFYLGLIDELKGIKESLSEIAKAQQNIAKVKIAELKLKYPDLNLNNI